MHPIFGVTQEYEELNEENKSLIAEILSGVVPRKSSAMLEAQRVVFEGTGEKGMLYLLQEGIVKSCQGDRELYFYDTGDLIGLEQFCEKEIGELRTDFAVMADEYSYVDLAEVVHGNPTIRDKWFKFIANREQLLNIMLAVSAQTKLEMHPEPLTIQPGEIIIEQGTTGTDVFTLVEGHLEVIVDGVKVGEILADEIFGAMAALTETPRSATVRALEFSVILKLPRERFLDLMNSRPLTVLKMIEDMSRTIVSLNERVVQLSNT